MHPAFAKPIIIAHAQELFAQLAQHHDGDVFYRTSDEALMVFGVDYWAEALREARQRYPDIHFTLQIVAGNTSGRILKAIEAGLSPLLCDVDVALRDKLQAIADKKSVMLLFNSDVDASSSLGCDGQ
jgi:hypothetical protein